MNYYKPYYLCHCYVNSSPLTYFIHLFDSFDSHTDKTMHLTCLTQITLKFSLRS